MLIDCIGADGTSLTGSHKLGLIFHIRNIYAIMTEKKNLLIQTYIIVQSTGGQRSKWSISEVFLHILVRDP